MTELERLQNIRKENYYLAQSCEDNIEKRYEDLIMKIVAENNFPKEKIIDICFDVEDIKPIINHDGWFSNYDYIRVRVGDIKDSHELTIYVGSDVMQINNCCSGSWEYDSWYYWYAKLMIILSEHSKEFTNICDVVDRKPLRDYTLAQRAVSHEEDRIRKEELDRQKQEHEMELDAAEYIGRYRKLRSYEDNYNADQDTWILESLYKVVKKTNKYFIVNQLFKEYENNHLADTWALRWPNDERIKKEQIYSLAYNYKAVDKNSINISE